MLSAIKQRIRDGYQRFSDGTSMHGFSELYYTKHIFWTLFWVVILVAALGVTTHQVVLATKQYLDQTTNTVISPASPSDIMFPPLKVCYPHWLYWFNFSKAEEMGLSKRATLFALSYLTDIYSTEEFDVQLAKNEFFEFYKFNFYTSLRDFFKTVAADDPFETELNFTRAGFLDDEEIQAYCEILNEDGVRNGVNPSGSQHKKRRTSKSTVLKFHVTQPPYDALGAWLDEEERADYFHQWLNRNSESDNVENENWLKYISDGMPLSIFPNSYDTDVFMISPDRNYYQVKIKLSVRTYKSTPRVPCISGYRWIEPNTTCEYNCVKENYIKLLSPPYDFSTAAFSAIDDISNTYGMDVIFSGSNVTGVKNGANPNNSDTDALWENVLEKCESACSDFNGCQTYTYDIIVTSSNIPNLPEKRYLISIEYPTEHEVLVMTEQDSQTWEGFVGNVGGLLGIWTGASVLSFIQMLYLCCFADSNGCPSWFRKDKNRAVETSDENRMKDTSKIVGSTMLTK